MATKTKLSDRELMKVAREWRSKNGAKSRLSPVDRQLAEYDPKGLAKLLKTLAEGAADPSVKPLEATAIGIHWIVRQYYALAVTAENHSTRLSALKELSRIIRDVALAHPDVAALVVEREAAKEDEQLTPFQQYQREQWKAESEPQTGRRMAQS